VSKCAQDVKIPRYPLVKASLLNTRSFEEKKRLQLHKIY